MAHTVTFGLADMRPVFPMEPIQSLQIPVGEEWTASVKWDGVRILTYYDGHETALLNRKQHLRTMHYPELADAAQYCQAKSIILDGEVIALDAQNKPSFHDVMRRDGIRRQGLVPTRAKEVPIVYMVFDILFYNGKSVTELPFQRRMDILFASLRTSPTVQAVPNYPDGEALFDVVKRHQLEGIVVKLGHSAYVCGERHSDWRKIKNYRDIIAVVGGYTAVGDVPNALLLGLPDRDEHLYYVATVGPGKLARTEWAQLHHTLYEHRVEKCPFERPPAPSRQVVWTKPRIAVKVQFIEWTKDSSLRQPTLQAVVDAPPDEHPFA